ncbi:MAG: HAMP domain-containing histidine kinase, partial [Lachnospiraceae bacterium]|nr:HAMP domain-containing histidine kinase [Lachnospiraceae bacterium]
MEKKNNLHIMLVSLVSVMFIGLIEKILRSGWEKWMLFPAVGGLIAMWVIHIGQFFEVRHREIYYVVLAAVGGLLFSVHADSLFDVTLVMGIIMLMFSLLDSVFLINLYAIEYLLLIIMQFTVISDADDLLHNPDSISRMIFHMIVFILMYVVCRIWIGYKKELNGAIGERDELKRKTDQDMEDFLSNISHELRTPVNVVNGMSGLILKKENRQDVEAIREAGIRLSLQIEDVQDYTEIKRGQVVIEKDKYMIISLINDVVTNLKLRTRQDDLEYIVDLDPGVPNMLEGDIRKIHKIIRHIVDNAVKFTARGGIYIGIRSDQKEYGANLIIEIADTGAGMTRKVQESASKGFYQANKKRNRSTGGIGLGLNIVYGFTHAMGGFVKITSAVGKGTKVRIVIPQSVIDPTPCLKVDHSRVGDVLFYVLNEKYKVPAVREFYRDMAMHIARGLKVNLYAASGRDEVEKSLEEMNVTHIFMGVEEYDQMPEYFDDLAGIGIKVVVCAPDGFEVHRNSACIVMPKPLYGFPVVKVLNGLAGSEGVTSEDDRAKPVFEGIRALIVDDDPMNLVV